MERQPIEAKSLEKAVEIRKNPKSQKKKVNKRLLKCKVLEQILVPEKSKVLL